MSGLPEGWEWDYDGTRWFYRYKPNGHIQYHFPSEGDEFPDYVDAASPIPTLAPEELLESQQQVKRQTSTSTGSRKNAASGSAVPAWKSRMSASARPVSNVWEDDADDGVFQPENFMFLGPGSYNDVSPLNEEEDEAARRVVTGGIQDRVERTTGKGVSPMASGGTTPQANSETTQPIISSEPVTVPPTVPEDQTIHFLDGREISHELPVEEPYNPVGIIAEMPTEDTAAARIETNPPPVEMADNTVLAPIETSFIAELPERTSPVAQKSIPVETPKTAQSVETQPREEDTVQPLRLGKKPAETGQYQPYKPGVATEPVQSSAPVRDEGLRVNRTALQREASLMMGGARSKTPPGANSNVPAVLSPPKASPNSQPVQDESPPPMVTIDSGAVVMVQDEPPQSQNQVQTQSTLSHIPSVLKPARHTPYQPNTPPPSHLQPLTERKSLDIEKPQDQKAEGGVAKYPSVLRPARGRAPSQPGQQPQFQAFNTSQQGHGYVPPSHGQHPPSMTPAPQEPQMGIQRINTVPEQLPSQKAAQAGYLPYPASDSKDQAPIEQPVRPASVMPALSSGNYQESAQQRNQPPQAQQPTRPASVAPAMGAGQYQKKDEFPQVQQPARPASVMPALGGSGQHQPFGQQQRVGPPRGETPYPEEMIVQPLAPQRGAGTQGGRPPRGETPYPEDMMGPFSTTPRPQSSTPYPEDPPSAPPTARPPADQPGPFGAPAALNVTQSRPPLEREHSSQMLHHQDEHQPIQPLRRQDTDPSPPDHGFRRHSSFNPYADISPPESRSGSISSVYPISPLEARRSSTNSLAQIANSTFTPSPMSSAAQSDPTPTPPSAISNNMVFSPPFPVSPPSSQAQQGQNPSPHQSGYFPNQKIEGQGHAVSAQNKLRKKSLGRQDSARRNSLPAGQSPLGSSPQSSNDPGNTASQGLYRSSSLRNSASPPNQQPTAPLVPPKIPQQNQMVTGHSLGRIEEFDEPEGQLRRPSAQSQSPEDSRRASANSLQHSPQGSRRQSWQSQGGSVDGGRSSPGVIAQQQQPPPPQGQMPPQMPPNQIHQGQAPPPGQYPPGRGPPLQMPPPGQVPPQGQLQSPQSYVPPPLQSHKQLQRKPSKGQPPSLAQIRAHRQQPSGQMSLPSQTTQPPQGQIPPQAQGPPGGPPPKEPLHPGQVPVAQSSQRDQLPSQGSRPLGNQAPQGQIAQGQMPPQGQVPPQGQPLQNRPPQGQMPPQGQIPPQGQMPQGQMPAQGQMPPQGQPQLGQMAPGQRPPAAIGQVPTQGQAPVQTQPPPQSQMPPQGQLRQGQVPPPGQKPFQGQAPQAQGALQGRPPQGVMPPQGQPPQGQVPPNGQMPPPNQLPSGQRPSGQLPPGQQPPGQHPPVNMLPQGQIPTQGQLTQGGRPVQGQMPPQGQFPPAQMPPGQPLHSRMPSQGQPVGGPMPPHGPMAPQVQIPQGQQAWGPNMQPPMAQNFQPGSGAPQGSNSPANQGKVKKWFKWPKSGSKPDTQGPSTPQQLQQPANAPPPRWGGGEYSQPAAWQPGQPVPPQAQARMPNPGQQPTQLTSMPPSGSAAQQPPQTGLAPPVTIPAQPIGSTGSPEKTYAQIGVNRQTSVKTIDTTISDISAISTIEVSEAKPQPVLKPQVVQVQGKTQDFGRNEAIQSQPAMPQTGPVSSHTRNQGSQSYQAPPGVQGMPVNQSYYQGSQGIPPSQTSTFDQRPLAPQGPPQLGQVTGNQVPPPNQGLRYSQGPPIAQEQPPAQPKLQGIASLPSQQVQAQPPPVKSQPTDNYGLSPAPLFSAAKNPASPPVISSGQHPDVRAGPAVVSQQAPGPNPPADDKWAKKPIADYSGGDWGDDDDWDY